MLVQNRSYNSFFRLLQSVIASLMFSTLMFSTLVCSSTLGGPTHSAGGAELYFVDLKDGGRDPHPAQSKTDDHLSRDRGVPGRIAKILATIIC
jgi:hypothetical protein